MTLGLAAFWIVTCRGCNKPLEIGSEDDRWPALFGEPADAAEAAVDMGWTTDGKVYYCPACPPAQAPGSQDSGTLLQV
ncbi:MAG: hypothetical protein ABR532_08440, partial [Candidatus Dormibacteria bacterium]